MDLSYKGTIAYAPLIVSLANTREVLYIHNRSGNTPSQSKAGYWLDKAIDLVSDSFNGVCLRGDSAYSLTTEFDRWDAMGVEFAFSYDAYPNLVKHAEKITQWQPMTRVSRQNSRCASKRRKQPRYREQVIKKRQLKNIKLNGEEVAEFDYRPARCKQSYRVLAVRKDLTIENPQKSLFAEDETRYFFYITNISDLDMVEAVHFCRQRCNHENDLDQLTHGVGAFSLPVNALRGNWAYMVIAALAWNLKAWVGLRLLTKRKKETGQHVLTCEFRRFVNEFVRIPAQMVRTGRRLIVRLLGNTPQAPGLFAAVT